MILGYYYVYKGMGDFKFFDKVKYFFDVYVKYFYGGVFVFNLFDIYWVNWMFNGKNFFEVYGFVNLQNKGSFGFYGQFVMFVNGVGQILQGQLMFGEQMVKVYKVFIGFYVYEFVCVGLVYGGILFFFMFFVVINGIWDSNYDLVMFMLG